MKTPRSERDANMALSERSATPAWQTPGKGHVYVKPTLMGGVAKTLSLILRRGAK